jgi:hypothetical protein
MKNLFLSILLFLLSSTAWTQSRVALHSGENITIFSGGNAFIEAYNEAVDGDYIYLPGGSLNFPATIDKSLTIIGVGHYPQATMATNKTVLTGNLNIGGNADGLYLEGFHLTGSLTFLTNQKADFVSMKRVRLGAVNYAGDATNPCSSNVIRESVIDGNIITNNANSILITNNIIAGSIVGGTDLTISNNMMLFDFYVYQNFTSSLVTNNIHLWNNPSSNYHLIYVNCVNNTFVKNITRQNIVYGANTFVDNYSNVDLATVFESVPTAVFSYDQNYAMLPAAQTTFTGNDTTQVGIFGGLFPYKTNAVPGNPSITSKTIASETNANGQLPVQVTVAAQNN